MFRRAGIVWGEMATLLLNCLIEDHEVEVDDDEHVVTIPAVRDGDQFVTLVVKLSPMPGEIEETFEFSFEFVISDLEGFEPTYATQDRFEVERYFDGLSREFILPNVCSAASSLVEGVQAPYIFRVTKGIKMPQKALAKHLLITDHLLGLGYHIVDEGTDGFGRLFWLQGR